MDAIEKAVQRMIEAQATEDEIGIARAILNGEPYYERVHPDGSKTRYELITPKQLRVAQAEAWNEGATRVSRATLDEAEWSTEFWLDENPYRTVE